MKILVTGCAGFIGSHVCERLLNAKINVIGIDNINDYYDQNNKIDSLKILFKYNNFTFVEEDIIDTKIIETFKPDKVIHLAAMAGVRYSLENPTLYCKVNIEGTVNLLEQSKNIGVDLFVYASSSSVYGNKDGEFIETQDLDVPESFYAATKQTVELMAKTYSKLYGLRTIGLRFFTVYGPRGRPDMAPYKFINKILNDEAIDKYGDGTSYRDYTYVDDIVDGIICAMNSEYKCEVFNLGNNKTWTLNDFIKMCEQVTNKKAILNEMGKQVGDVNGTSANIDKSKVMLGYNPVVGLLEGLTNLNSSLKK
jgi:UDP-glucuronate 4-epimerase